MIRLFSNNDTNAFSNNDPIGSAATLILNYCKMIRYAATVVLILNDKKSSISGTQCKMSTAIMIHSVK